MLGLYSRRKCICTGHSLQGGRSWGSGPSSCKGFSESHIILVDLRTVFQKGEIAVPYLCPNRIVSQSFFSPCIVFLLWKNARAPFNLPFIPNIYDLFAVVTWGQWKGREERAKHRCIPYVSREMFSMLFNLKIKLKRRNERELIFFEYPHHTNYRHFLI